MYIQPFPSALTLIFTKTHEVLIEGVTEICQKLVITGWWWGDWGGIPTCYSLYIWWQTNLPSQCFLFLSVLDEPAQVHSPRQTPPKSIRIFGWPIALREHFPYHKLSWGKWQLRNLTMLEVLLRGKSVYHVWQFHIRKTFSNTLFLFIL